MAGQLKLSTHEMLELHEIIRGEVTCAKKIQANIGAVMDGDLKAFMQDSLEKKKGIINKYHDLYDQAVEQKTVEQ
ncbi:MAG TPA: hypothetical protein GXX46_06450 [Peptococcaceae bacterium]|nr:hypothetical protein [Peptococcaceae bacterium]